MNLQDKLIGLRIYFFMMRTDEQRLFMFNTAVIAEATKNNKTC